MPIIDNWNLQLTTDQVLRAQGADPDTIRSRRPALVSTTEVAISRGQPLMRPQVLYKKYKVKHFVHERLELIPDDTKQGNYSLSGQLIAEHLTQAHEVIVILCTIGSDLDNTVSSLFNVDPIAALALDGVGSAAVEMLAIQACNYFEIQAKNDSYNTSIPLNPGMIGWPLDAGQLQIFSLLDCEEIQVSLTESCMMIPQKSLSLVLGIGTDLSAIGSTCEYCSLKGICRYQNHYAKQD
jgi:hypothetical protein